MEEPPEKKLDYTIKVIEVKSWEQLQKIMAQEELEWEIRNKTHK